QRGMNDDALKALDHSVEMNPDNAEAFHLLAFVLGDLGRHEEARQAGKKAAQLNPSLAKAQSNLSLEGPEGRTDERAQGRMETALADAPSLAHYNLGRAFRQK